tara:strand:+ start:1744 stop:2253 length:510 start_codon:yes stop_codon:yes gene_type:complete
MSAYIAAAKMAASTLSGEAADAVFAATYNKQISIFNAGQQVNALEDQLSTVKQEQVLSVANVQLNQDAAEAQAKVNAAAAGVSGGSVEQVIYETNKDAAFAVGNINAQADADTNALSKQVQSASLGLASAQSTKVEIPSLGAALLGSALQVAAASTEGEREDFMGSWSS